VKYREVDSDESDFEYDEFTKVVTVEPFEDNSDDEDYKPGDNVPAPDATPKVIYPPLSPLQLRLRKVCRLGDKHLLQTFLAETPGVELDVKDPDGGTILTETATKTAQFCDIADALMKAGAGLEVSDSLGNTPLHNAVLYFPSTQRTVDLLLQHGASVTSKNHEGIMPEGLAEDKDLKLVLKELRKAAGRKKCTSTSVSLYLNSPDLRRKVYDKVLVEERFKQEITVKYNTPPVVNSPGLLKRKRKIECLDDSVNERRSKRIRWNEVDSAGRDIDPQFSSEEDCGTSQDEDAETRGAYRDNSEAKTDEEEDIVIVHNDVKNNTSLDSDTELCLGKPNISEEGEDSGDGGGEEEDIETCFIPESITLDSSKEDFIILDSSGGNSREGSEHEQDHLGDILDRVERDSGNRLVQEEKDSTAIQSRQDEGNTINSVCKDMKDEVVNSQKELRVDNDTLDRHDNKNDHPQRPHTDPAGTSSSSLAPSVSDQKEQDNCAVSDIVQERVKEETKNIVAKDHEICVSGVTNQDEAGQFVRKCSQGFGFFVS